MWFSLYKMEIVWCSFQTILLWLFQDVLLFLTTSEFVSFDIYQSNAL